MYELGKSSMLEKVIMIGQTKNKSSIDHKFSVESWDGCNLKPALSH